MNPRLYPIVYFWEFRKIRRAVARLDNYRREDIESCGGVPRYVKFNVQRKVACAAIRYGDFIVVGVRHYCPLMQAQIDAIGRNALNAYSKRYGNIQPEQGFVDQYQSFLTRKEAFAVALEAGQVEENLFGDYLFSEMYI